MCIYIYIIWEYGKWQGPNMIDTSSRFPSHLSRKEAESLREGLSQHVPCAFYHGDLTAEARQKAGGMSWKRTTPTKMSKE